MKTLSKLTLCALLALAPTLSAAQTQILTAPEGRTATVAPHAIGQTFRVPSAETTRRGPGVSYLNGAQSVCPPGNGLQWQIIENPLNEPNGAHGYVLGCD